MIIGRRRILNNKIPLKAELNNKLALENLP